MKNPYELKNGTLKNKLGIDKYSELREAERDLGFFKLITLDNVDTSGSRIQTIKRIHKYIFDDIYEWAGNFRKVSIEKREVVVPGTTVKYEDWEKIESSLEVEFKELEKDNWNPNNLEQFVKLLTEHTAKIWRIHPFRDGNTRTTLAFAYLFAKENEIDLNLGNILNHLSREIDQNTNTITQYSVRDRFVLAALDEKDCPEPQYLEWIFRQAISLKKKEKGVIENTEYER